MQQPAPPDPPIPPAATATVPLAALLFVWAGMLLLGGGGIDQAIITGAHLSEQPGLTLALIVTRLGDWEILVALTFLAAGWLMYRRQMPTALFLLGSTLLARLLVGLQKAMLGRVRPEQDNPFVVEESFAFPSGHAANSLIVYLMLALLLTEDRAKRKLAMAAAILASLLIGLSRVLLGVHWPSDVVGGWAFGLFWLLLSVRLWRAGVKDR